MSNVPCLRWITFPPTKRSLVKQVNRLSEQAGQSSSRHELAVLFYLLNDVMCVLAFSERVACAKCVRKDDPVQLSSMQAIPAQTHLGENPSCERASVNQMSGTEMQRSKCAVLKRPATCLRVNVFFGSLVLFVF